MLLLSLAWRSLRNRALLSTLTVLSIALSVALLLGIEQVRVGVRESFAGTIKGTDLIVGARGGTTQVLLSTVFGMSAPTGSVSWATYERWAAHPAVKWAVPYALGDAHRGFRVIGTTAAFFERYRFRDRTVTFTAGRPPPRRTPRSRSARMWPSDSGMPSGARSCSRTGSPPSPSRSTARIRSG